MTRRWIPPIAAVLVATLATLPIWLGVAAEVAANRWTLTLVAVVFAFKAAIFAWMRQRMGGGESLTLFGMALRDFFLSLTLNALALTAFFGVFAWASWQAIALERWQIVALRAALASSGTLLIGTGFGTCWEMGRARTGPRMVVHVPPREDRTLYDGPNRRGDAPGRRATDR